MKRVVRRLWVTITQIIVLATFLAAWEWLPQVQVFRRIYLLDPFFISSPSRIVNKLIDLTTGRDGTSLIWTYVWPTMGAAIGGLVSGLLIGTVAGVVIGSSAFVSAVFKPFIIAVNAIPRIALIPIIVLIFGPTLQGSIAISFMVAFFVVFFNAYEGARSPSIALVQNARLLGARWHQVMFQIRAPYAVVWTLAALPVVATFALVSVVTGEILTGFPGLGRLISIASSTVDSTLTFAVVVVLSVLGLTVVGVSELLKRRLLHWWADGRG